MKQKRLEIVNFEKSFAYTLSFKKTPLCHAELCVGAEISYRTLNHYILRYWRHSFFHYRLHLSRTFMVCLARFGFHIHPQEKVVGTEIRVVWGPWEAWSVGYQSVRKISLKPYHSNLQSVCSRSWITEPTTMQILNHRLIRPRLHKFVISITVNWTSKIFLKINHASFVRLDLQHLGSICRICLVGSVDCFFRIASSRALPDRFPPALNSCLVYPLAWCFSGR